MAKKVEIAAKSPGIYRNCGATNQREYFVDMEYIEDFHGTVYFCSICFDQIAKAIGYKLADRTEVTSLEQRIEQLETENRELTRGIDALAGIGFDLVGYFDYAVSQDRGESARHRIAAIQRRETGMDEGKVGTPESPDGQGHFDFSSPTGADKLSLSLG